MAYICNPSFVLQQWVVTGAGVAGVSAASASRAAGAAGVRHVARRAKISFAAGLNVQAPLVVNLRDGATGAGTVLCSWTVATGANDAAGGTTTPLPWINNVDVSYDNLHLVGTAATAMTLEFAGATVVDAASSVTLYGYDISNTN